MTAKVEARRSPVRAGDGVEVNPAANQTLEQIIATQINDWTMRDYVFTASQGLAATDVSSVATESHTTPVASLQSPTGKNKLIIPLRVWASVTNDGAGLGYVDLCYTKAAKECATALTLSGTAFNLQNSRTFNPMVTPTATALMAVTASALTTVDYITLAHKHWPNAALTTSLIVPDFDYQFETPIALTEGAALLLYFYNATTTDAKLVVSFTWAELDASIYIP